MALPHFLTTSHHLIPYLLLCLVAYLTFKAYSLYDLSKRRKYFEQHHGCKPCFHSAPGDPLGLSTIYEIVQAAREASLLEFFHKNFKRYGRTYRMGNGSFQTNDAENIKAILSTRFDDWYAIPFDLHGLSQCILTHKCREAKPVRQHATYQLLGDGIFTTDGAFWAHSRSLLRPAFEKSTISDLRYLEPHIQALLSQIPADGTTVDLQELFNKFTMDTSSELLMGTSTSTLSGGAEAKRAWDFVKDFEVAMDDVISRATMRGLYWFTSFRPKAWAAVARCKAYVEGFVVTALRRKDSAEGKGKGKGEFERKFVFLEELARQEGVSKVRVRDESLNVLFAGRDTTASLLSNLWFALARHLEVWRKLQEEIGKLDGAEPEYEELRNMKYLKYCIQESTYQSERQREIRLFVMKIMKQSADIQFYSSPPLPTSPHARQNLHARHLSPARRRARRSLASFHPQGYEGHVQHEFDATPARRLWIGCRNFSSRALGGPKLEARLELPPLRRWTESLFRPAIRADGGRVRYC
jgi:cytochrome P450